jgi:nicotinamidase/pyrazinamidase
MRVKLTDRDALVVVDMQNDFMPYGVLPVKDADKIVPTINKKIWYNGYQNIDRVSYKRFYF